MTKNYGRRGNMQKDISNAMGEAIIKELRDRTNLSQNGFEKNTVYLSAH